MGESEKFDANCVFPPSLMQKFKKITLRSGTQSDLLKQVFTFVCDHLIILQQMSQSEHLYRSCTVTKRNNTWSP